MTARPDPHRPAPLTSHVCTTARHRTHYLAAGPVDGPLMIFVHGWPGLGLMWRAQMESLAADGWRCIAPDMRGYGGSGIPASARAYTLEEAVGDLVELHDSLGAGPAVWVGHDWGSIVVGQLGAHEAARARGLVLVSWAYFPDANGLDTLVPLVDRSIYPADEYPDGQWDYYRYYTTDFASAVADLDADTSATLADVYRSGRREAIGAVAPSATVTRRGGRFGAAHRAPRITPDPSLWPASDLEHVEQAFASGGFRGPCSWYLNDDANRAYAHTAPRAGRLTRPVLFVNGQWDALCTIDGNRQGDPMRAACADLTVVSLPGGHWLPLECKAEVGDVIRAWSRRLA